MTKKTTINKTVLKRIVKECLVEILAEGIGGDLDERITEVSSKKRVNQTGNVGLIGNSTQHQQRRSGQMSAAAQKARQEFLNEMAAAAAGQNPVMQEMFRETLSSGRAESFAEESETVATPKDAVSQVIEDLSPEEMFGDVANTWASVAFKGMDVPDDK